MKPRWGILALRLAVAVLGPAPVAAQDSAASEALFNKAVSEMERRNYGIACPAFAESYRIEPRTGTLYAVAECESAWGKVASASAHYADYLLAVSRLPAAQQANHKDRVERARAQRFALQPRIPQLTIVLADGAPAALVVKRDGVVLGSASLGTTLPIDPGDHVLTTEVPGGPVHTQSFRIELSESRRVEAGFELPAQQPATAPGAAPDVPTSFPAPRPSARASDTGVQPSGPPNRTGAYVAGALGLAGIVAGSISGAMAFKKKSTVDASCDAAGCTEEGRSAANAGKTYGNISTAGLVVGGVGLAAAVVLWLTAGSKAPSRPRAKVAPAVPASEQRGPMLGVQGSW